METMNMSPEEKFDIIAVTAAVLHLGNIEFVERGVEVAETADKDGEKTLFLDLFTEYLWFVNFRCCMPEKSIYKRTVNRY